MTVDEEVLLLFLDLDTIEVLSSTATVCAEFRTGTELSGSQRQPDPSVVAIVGPYGEALANSPQVTVFGSATANPSNWLEVSLQIPMDSHVLNEIIDLQDREPRIEPRTIGTPTRARAVRTARALRRPTELVAHVPAEHLEVVALEEDVSPRSPGPV